MRNVGYGLLTAVCMALCAVTLHAQEQSGKVKVDSTLAAQHLYALSIRAGSDCTVKINGIGKGVLKQGLELTVTVPVGSCRIEAVSNGGALYDRTFDIAPGLAGQRSYYDIIFPK